MSARGVVTGSTVARTAAALALAAPGACAPPVSDGGFDAPDPASRIYAVERAARDGDRAAIGPIVECLDSDDPALRLVASQALLRLTGETLGYDPSDPAPQREAAVVRWIEYVQAPARPSATGGSG